MDLNEWLKEKCCYCYLPSQKQEEEYFSEWFNECHKQKKEDKNNEDMKLTKRIKEAKSLMGIVLTDNVIIRHLFYSMKGNGII